MSMTKEEMDRRVREMTVERQRQDAEARARYSGPTGGPTGGTGTGLTEPTGSRFMTREEMDRRVREMTEERQRQDAEARAQYSGSIGGPTGPAGGTGTGPTGPTGPGPTGSSQDQRGPVTHIYDQRPHIRRQIAQYSSSASPPSGASDSEPMRRPPGPGAGSWDDDK